MRTAICIAVAVLPFLLLGAGIAYGWQPARRAQLRLHGQRLPRPLALLKAALRLILWAGGGYLVHDGFIHLHRVAHGDSGTAQPGSLAGLLMLEAAILAAAIPAYGAADLIGAAIPPLRRAERLARDSLPALRPLRAALEMLAMGALMIPAALAQGVLGALEPWSR